MPSAKQIMNISASAYFLGQCLCCFKQSSCCCDEFPEKTFIFIPVTFVFGKIAAAVRKIEQPPLIGFVAQRMRQALKDNVAAVRAVATAAQCGERKTMCCVVREIETAGIGEGIIRGIIQSHLCETDHAPDVIRVCGFGLQLPGLFQVFQ